LSLFCSIETVAGYGFSTVQKLSAALIGKTVGQLVVFRCPPPEVKMGFPELTPAASLSL
jgi:hypothetical protein